MIDRKHIGAEGSVRYIDVEKSQLKLFCQAIGETNPIYLDEAAAKKAGYPGIPIPPTYAHTLANLTPPEREIMLDIMKVDLARCLHGEQGYEYHKPIYVGDRVRLQQKVVDIYDKKGGALEFVVMETQVHNQRGELCVTIRTVGVVRN